MPTRARILTSIGLAWSALGVVMALGLASARENVEAAELRETNIALVLAVVAFAVMVAIAVRVFAITSPVGTAVLGAIHVALVAVGLGLVWETAW